MTRPSLPVMMAAFCSANIAKIAKIENSNGADIDNRGNEWQFNVGNVGNLGNAEGVPMSTATSAATANVQLSSAAKRYRLVLCLSIVANLVVGIIILFWPDSFTSFAGQPNARPDTWPRHWGMQLWAINLLYLPGYWNPAENRFQNWIGIGVRLTFAAFFFLQGDGFVPMGIYDGVSGLILLFCYLPVVKDRS